jgi:predicted GNAT family acetyltransferase
MVQISRIVDLIIAKITKKKNMTLHLAKTKINDSIKKRGIAIKFLSCFKFPD